MVILRCQRPSVISQCRVSDHSFQAPFISGRDAAAVVWCGVVYLDMASPARL